jgi:hypothetical protein
MGLSVNGKMIDSPSADDIARAFGATPNPEDWSIILEIDDGSYVDAVARDDGTYDVTASAQERDLQADVPLEANRVKEILSRFLAGDTGWRDTGFSPIPDSKTQVGSGAAARTGEPPTWAVAIVVASIAIVVLSTMLPVRDYLPFGDSDFFYVGLIASPLVVLVVVAVLAKMLDVRRASTWSTAVGRVVRSDTEASRHGFAGEATTVTTNPRIEYEFSVGGRAWRGNRISIGDDTGGANTEATLRAYPMGATVSVYYDPANPRNCVLVREIPKGVGKGLLILVALAVAVAVGIYWLATNGPRLLSAQLPNVDNAPLAIFAGCFGLVVLLFFIASYRLSRRAADWPLVRGKVLSSGSEQIRSNDSGGTRKSYAPVVEYRYRVNDVDYVSRQIKLGWVLSSSQAYATKVSARYPKGSDVDVHYDPANPSNAALENPGGFYWLLLAVALGCFAIAARAAGFF